MMTSFTSWMQVRPSGGKYDGAVFFCLLAEGPRAWI
jgi:hypothetical protein